MLYIYVNVYNLIGVNLVIVDILNFKIDWIESIKRHQ